MQEEVEQRVVTLVINCTKLTEQELRKALGKFLAQIKTKHQKKQPHGKMTVKQLAAQNRGLQSVEVTDQNIGSFKRIARKYGIDFAPYKAKGQDRYLIFFKSQDAEAFQHTKRECFADTARRTARYILRELTSVEGGFSCGQDADSDGVEGKYYVFTPEEVKAVLEEEDGEEFCRLYDITDPGNYEGKSIPNRIHSFENSWDMNDPRLEKLYHYRLNRTKLHKDDKILLSWNAWAMIALAKAGQVLEKPSYLDAAFRIRDFIEGKMVTEHDRLYLRYRDGEAAYVGQLEDYAVYALALLELYRVSFEVRFLQTAIHRAKQMVELFEDEKNGGYFMNAFDGEQLIARPKETYDGAIPSGNSVAAMVLQTLASLTGERSWQAAADRQLRFLAGGIGEFPSASCFGVLSMMDALYPHRELVCTTSDGFPSELKDYLKEYPADDLHVLLKNKNNAETLAVCAPFTKDYPIPEQGSMYYLCENNACKVPVPDFSRKCKT